MRRGIFSMILALAGCSGEVTPTMAPDQFFSAITTSSCQARWRCLGFAAYLAPTCTGDAVFGMSSAQLQTAVARGRIRYDASQARTCAEALAKTSCDQRSLSGIPAACAATVQGAVVPGDACYYDSECDGGFCDRTGCPGTCKPFGTVCSTSIQCDRAHGKECVNGACAAFAVAKPVGAACAMDFECQGVSYCKVGPGQVLGACRPRVSDGGACGTLDVPVTACGAQSACKGASLSSSARPGTCTRLVDIGGSCAVNTAVPGGLVVSGCKAGLVCDGGACRIPPATGRCAFGVPRCRVDTSFCNEDGNCEVRQRAIGAHCEETEQCKPGLFCDASTETCVVQPSKLCYEP